MAQTATPPNDLDLTAIESRLERLITSLTPAPARRGRPEILPGALLWSAMLVCLLRGEPCQRAIWRLVSQTGLWHFPRIAISAEGVHKRLVTAGAAPMATLFTQITAALGARWHGDQTLAPFATGGVYALDATTLDKVVRLLPTSGAAVRPLAGKLHTVFDVRRQLFRTILPTDLPQQNERVAMPDLVATVPADSLLLFDRGYLSFPRFDALTDANQWFITRLGVKVTTTTVHVLTDQAGLRDELVWLGRYRADKAAHLVRLITLQTAAGERRYLTNVRDPEQLSVAEIARLYARRWDIELAFKLIKRELGLHLIWSTSWELILSQVWGTALIAQIVLATRQELATRAEVDVFDISLSLLVKVLPDMLARGTGDALDQIVARRNYGGIIRKSRRKTVAVPDILAVTPPPANLPTWRTPRYAGKA